MDPTERFAVPLDEGDGSAFDDFEHAAEDIAEQSRANNEYDDPFAEEDIQDEFEDGFVEDGVDGQDDGPREAKGPQAVAQRASLAQQ